MRAQLDAPFRSGATPLLIACNGGHDKCVRSLLAAGADPSIAASNGDTPLSTSRKLGFGRCTALLVTEASALSHDPACPYLLGEPVVLVGLKAKPELNGKEAWVVGFDAAKGRYSVRHEGNWRTGKPIGIKPENLLFDQA